MQIGVKDDCARRQDEIDGSDSEGCEDQNVTLPMKRARKVCLVVTHMYVCICTVHTQRVNLDSSMHSNTLHNYYIALFVCAFYTP